MIPIPYKTIRQIDAALASPNLRTLRRTLDDATKQMQPLIELGRRNMEIELSNRNMFDLGLPR
jgi:hypothetical protein